jgi:hypothetical protein
MAWATGLNAAIVRSQAGIVSSGENAPEMNMSSALRSRFVVNVPPCPLPRSQPVFPWQPRSRRPAMHVTVGSRERP